MTAGRDVLLALPGVTPEQVDTFIAARDDALKNQLPIPPFPQAQGFAGAASPVWRIHVVARTPDGVTFARDAVLRPLVDARRPLVDSALAGRARGPDVRPDRDREICAGKWNRQALIFGSGGARPFAPPRPHRVLAMVGGRARAADPAPLAQRGGEDAHAPGPGVRGGRRRALRARARQRPPAYKEAARIPLTGDPDAVAAGGTRRDRSAVARRGRRQDGPAQIVVALPRTRFCARRSRLPAAVEDNLAPGRLPTTSTGTRPSSPTRCASTRTSSRATRSSGRCASIGRRRSRRSWTIAAPRRKLGRGGGRRHARRPSGPPATGKALNLLPIAERPEAADAAPMECLGADRSDRSGGARRDRAARSGRNADMPSRSCNSRARGGCRPMPRTRCASSSNGSPAITTSRWRRNTRIRARCSRSRT